MAKTDSVIEQAGAIAFRMVRGRPSVLLVRSRKKPVSWIFPKGHIEAGEMPVMTAMRELGEEAGVMGYPLRRAGSNRYLLNGRQYHVVYFLLRFVARVGKGERGRTPAWCSLREARSRLSIPAHRKLLDALLPFLLEQE